jgi:acetoin utilization protein AcuC
VSSSVRVVWDDALAGYDFGPAHPLAPVRVVLTMALAASMGVLDQPSVTVTGTETAGDELLRLVHDAGYLDAVRRAGTPPLRADVAHGLGTPDDPLFEGMHDASALVAGASVTAARAVWSDGAEHAVNIAGGLHHAMPRSASGFCIYNDPAIAIAWLLGQGAQRVAYVDVDVHHGDGVQTVFYDDPRVLTISLHESGRYLFPGTGFPDEVGGPEAEGSSVNVALPPATRDAGWLRAFHAVVPPLVRAFRPDVLVTQHGCDSHVLDPLAHLALTIDGQRTSYAALHRLAHEVANGRWVAFGGGGYELVQVVPRVWTHLLAEAAGAPIDPEAETPESWRAAAMSRTGQVAPVRMTDGAVPDFAPFDPDAADPADPLDGAILDTRSAVFGHHGLDPWAAVAS